MIRLSVLVLMFVIALGRTGDAFVPDAGFTAPSRDGGLVMLDRWVGPGDDLITARVLLRENQVANLTILAGPGDCASPPPDGTADANPDQAFSAVFVACCKVCSAGKACGDTCIAASLTCHTAAGCACNAGAAPAPNPVLISTPTPRAVIGVIGQSSYPTIRVGQTAELLLTADVTGSSAPDGTLEERVANTLEIGGGLRGWDSTGLIAFNRAASGSSTRQVFRGLIEGVKPGTYRVRVVFSDTAGSVPPDGVYWDVTVLAPVAATPAVVTQTPAAARPTEVPATTAFAAAAPTAAPAAQGASTGSGDGSGGGTVVLLGAVAAIAGWIFYRRKRSDL